MPERRGLFDQATETAASGGCWLTYPDSRSPKACLRRLTHDRQQVSVCRVPRNADSDPAWLIDQRRQLGDRVRAARLHANLTQERLEHVSGVKRLTIQNIEAGTTDARVGWLMRIARACGIHVRDLLS